MIDSAILIAVALADIVTSLPAVALVTFAVTVIHTIDETVSDGGPIWEYLQHWLPLNWFVMLFGYMLFQSIVVVLGALAWSGGIWFGLYVAQRLGDVVITHGVLADVQSPNPGRMTAWMLLADVAFTTGCVVQWGC